MNDYIKKYIYIYMPELKCLREFSLQLISGWLEVLDMEALFLLRNRNSGDENLQGVIVMFVVAMVRFYRK